MKTKVFLITLILTIYLVNGCSKENNRRDNDLSYSDFEVSLKADMTYPVIVGKFGEPAKDIGSGIHIYVYILVDSTEMWIGYTDKILYARHMNSNHQQLHSLI